MYAPFFPSLFLFFAWARAVPLSLSLSQQALPVVMRECCSFSVANADTGLGPGTTRLLVFRMENAPPPRRTPLRVYRATSRGLLCS